MTDTTPGAIERDIPIPTRKGRPPKYEFSDLEVGDSRLFHGDNGSIKVCAVRRGRALGRMFTTRQVDGGTRVWRVA